jgi:hypothetical protein
MLGGQSMAFVCPVSIAEAVLRDTTYRGYPLIHSLNDRRVLGYVNRGDLARTLGVSAAALFTSSLHGSILSDRRFRLCRMEKLVGAVNVSAARDHDMKVQSLSSSRDRLNLEVKGTLRFIAPCS